MAPLLAGRDPGRCAPQPRRGRCARAGQGGACGALRDRNPAHPPAAWGSPPGAGGASRAPPGLPLQLKRLQRPWAPRKGGAVRTQPRVSTGCLASPCQAGGTYQPLRNAVPGDVEPLSSRSTLRGEASHPAAAQWQGHSLLCEQEAGFV